MKIDLKQFEQDKKIDPSQLDMEAVKQAETFFDWAEKAAELKAKVDRAKLALDTTEARLQLEARRQLDSFPGLYGAKITEAAINAAVKVHPDLQTAHEKWTVEKEKLAVVEKAVEAMEQKKRMIETLVTLHGQQYFAGPSVPRDLVGAWQNAQEKSMDKQKSQARRRKKGKRNE